MPESLLTSAPMVAPSACRPVALELEAKTPYEEVLVAFTASPDDELARTPNDDPPATTPCVPPFAITAAPGPESDIAGPGPFCVTVIKPLPTVDPLTVEIPALKVPFTFRFC